MKTERSDVEFPLWRKKVDKSLFDHNGTTVPFWACNMWNLQTMFKGVSSKSNPNSIVEIHFENKIFKGWITNTIKGRSTPLIRLWYPQDLTFKIKHAFLMSYMRSLEQRLTSEKRNDVEIEIPFWEFLDIEFDSHNKTFVFVAYYKQKSSFPNLFNRLIDSPGMKRIDDELRGKENGRIHKQDWKPRSEVQLEIGAMNVIYYLIDTQNQLLYIGEAKDLVSRLLQSHPSIPHWNHFRYNVLHKEIEKERVTLERMIIRDFASFLSNKKDVSWFNISDFKLANDKIDI